MSNGGGIVTQGLGSSGVESGHAEQVTQVVVSRIAERLEGVIEDAINEFGAKGLSFVAVHSRILEIVDKVLRKHPNYYLLNINKMSPEMKITIGLERREVEKETATVY